jgi:cell division protein FtsB
VIGIALLGVALYFALFGGEYSFLELQRIRREMDLESERLIEARRTIDSLRARVDSLENDSATIERVARERWGLIRPGERLYRFEERDSSRDSSSAPRRGFNR